MEFHEDVHRQDHSQRDDDKACISLRGLVCGLPSTERQRRVWLMLQVFVDDSGRGENEAIRFSCSPDMPELCGIGKPLPMICGA